MNIAFLSVNDVRNSEYAREGNKNLLKTKFGTADTIALCGRLEGAEVTRYGPRLWINDGDKLPVVIGTFNKNARKDAEQIVEEFNKSKGEMFVLVYGNPYETDKIYINVNHENSVIVVDKWVYEKFHEMQKLAEQYLTRKSGIIEKKIEIAEEKGISGEISDSDLINLIKREDKGDGIRIDEFLKLFKKESRSNIEERIYQLIESGELYEPKAGVVRVVE